MSTTAVPSIPLRRVVVTGMGAICGLGNDLTSVWKAATAGQSGIGPLDALQAKHPDIPLPVKYAATVKNFTMDETWMALKDQSRYDTFNLFALQAAGQALQDAGLLGADLKLLPDLPKEKIGCLLGVGIGGLPMIEEQTKILMSKGPRRITPFFIPGVIPNMATGLISIRFDTRGINYTLSSACASSAHAISSACSEILLGRQQIMLAGGAEAVISPLSISGFASMKALSSGFEATPGKASRPFDIKRDGFVMGEGAGILILEEYESARRRGARIYAEIVGHGMSSDAHHITAPHPEGLGAMACMQMALDSAGLAPEQIGYVNAHGTSTPLGDIAETKAIKKVFGTHAKKLKISSTKSMTGHLLGAAGGLETIFCIKALETGIVPPTINLEFPDPECDLDYCPNQSQKIPLEFALNSSFGFGGTNASLIVKKMP